MEAIALSVPYQQEEVIFQGRGYSVKTHIKTQERGIFKWLMLMSKSFLKSRL